MDPAHSSHWSYALLSPLLGVSPPLRFMEVNPLLYSNLGLDHTPLIPQAVLSQDVSFHLGD